MNLTGVRLLRTLVLVLLCAPLSALHAKDTIELQGLLGSKAVVNVNGNRHVLHVGQTSSDGVKLIAINADGVTLEVHGKRGEYRMGGAISTSFTRAQVGRETVYADERGMFHSVGSINGQTVRFLIDTGATFVAMNKSQAKQLGIRYRIDGEPARASTASGYVRGYLLRLNSVVLGGLKLSNVDAMVIDGDHPGPILLGMSFLSKLKVETSGKVMQIEQRKSSSTVE